MLLGLLLSCVLRGPSATQVVPASAGPEGSSPGERWNRHALELLEHERGHVAIALLALPTLQDAMVDADCDEMDSVFPRWSAALAAWQLAYDSCSEHGVIQDLCGVDLRLEEARWGLTDLRRQLGLGTP